VLAGDAGGDGCARPARTFPGGHATPEGFAGARSAAQPGDWPAAQLSCCEECQLYLLAHPLRAVHSGATPERCAPLSPPPHMCYTDKDGCPEISLQYSSAAIRSASYGFWHTPYSPDMGASLMCSRHALYFLPTELPPWRISHLEMYQMYSFSLRRSLLLSSRCGL